MKRRILILLLILSLTGCAGTSATKMVQTYEAMGAALKSAHDSGVRLCEVEKVIPPEDCAKIKRIYSDTRRVYLVTGDTLAFAIQAQNTDWKDPANAQVQLLTKAFSDLTLQWLRLTTELGLIKEETK